MEHRDCRNPSLGLTTKARGCKVAGQEGSLRVMPHAPKSVRECEGINLHTPKVTPTLGVGVLVDSWMFRERLQGSKPNGFDTLPTPWKIQMWVQVKNNGRRRSWGTFPNS
jgi:hypothetical protein